MKPYEDDEEEFDDNFSEEIEKFEKEKASEELLVSVAEGQKTINDLLNLKEVVMEVGKFVVFTYEGELFPGRIIGFNDKEVNISSMQRSLKSWKWPTPEDNHNYVWEDILGGINPPKQISKRGFYEVPELSTIWD